MPEFEPLYRPRLQYPERALRLRREGRVIVEFQIGSDGAPHDVRVVEATPPGLFEQSALRYAAGLRYTPDIAADTDGLVARERARQRLVVRFEMRGQA
ncbi:TonB family protein [Niveispirillum sp. SYP-B3756]|uniref:energy transducer TonB n=1 Tax=Niveispirillum sp. SYP-B3756 TaxID=2662178 RepID=UPI00129289C5|nr:energy transducer TonB [Niveispirillum sp. SYP-B3756]MQP63784.1 TonB family protein [Niveispirillum sp. SYP-B3756]